MIPEVRQDCSRVEKSDLLNNNKTTTILNSYQPDKWSLPRDDESSKVKSNVVTTSHLPQVSWHKTQS